MVERSSWVCKVGELREIFPESYRKRDEGKYLLKDWTTFPEGSILDDFIVTGDGETWYEVNGSKITQKTRREEGGDVGDKEEVLVRAFLDKVLNTLQIDVEKTDGRKGSPIKIRSLLYNAENLSILADSLDTFNGIYECGGWLYSEIESEDEYMPYMREVEKVLFDFVGNTGVI